MGGTTLTNQLVGWLPFHHDFSRVAHLTRRAAARQGSVAEIGRENTKAVRQNTEALKALLAKLESQSKQ
ncbi:MAG: hypothetical protein EOS58_06535 [Mesorhizobium sp.]|nr:MAG: hypothetical protein EOS58_06535 [Mesorhizobium sp.]